MGRRHVLIRCCFDTSMHSCADVNVYYPVPRSSLLVSYSSGKPSIRCWYASSYGEGYSRTYSSP